MCFKSHRIEFNHYFIILFYIIYLFILFQYEYIFSHQLFSFLLSPEHTFVSPHFLSCQYRDIVHHYYFIFCLTIFLIVHKIIYLQEVLNFIFISIQFIIYYINSFIILNYFYTIIQVLKYLNINIISDRSL